MTRNDLPRGAILAVCGWSGSGKTTLLREAISTLVGRGLSVAACKHDAHGIQVDRKGKDSDLLFHAGANVVVQGPGQSLARLHEAPEANLPGLLATLLRRHDVVLVEGHKDTPLPKVWVARDGEPEPPDGVTDVLSVLPPGEARIGAFHRLLDEWLPRAWREPRVLGGVLLGGGSRRMGQPKQLLELEGRTFLERAVDALDFACEEVVLLGDGEIPDACRNRGRLPDPPDLAGPLAGILGALRWAPGATWIVAGCDQPLISREAVEWLLDRRTPGKWAILPRVGEGGVEPLLAIYDARARTLLESFASSGRLAPSALADHSRTDSPSPNPDLLPAWRNVNTPEELARLRHPDTG